MSLEVWPAMHGRAGGERGIREGPGTGVRSRSFRDYGPSPAVRGAATLVTGVDKRLPDELSSLEGLPMTPPPIETLSEPNGGTETVEPRSATRQPHESTHSPTASAATSTGTAPAAAGGEG